MYYFNSSNSILLFYYVLFPAGLLKLHFTSKRESSLTMHWHKWWKFSHKAYISIGLHFDTAQFYKNASGSSIILFFWSLIPFLLIFFLFYSSFSDIHFTYFIFPQKLCLICYRRRLLSRRARLSFSSRGITNSILWSKNWTLFPHLRPMQNHFCRCACCFYPIQAPSQSLSECP